MLPTSSCGVGCPDATSPTAPASPSPNGADSASRALDEPDEETAIALATLDPATSLFVESKGTLIATIELVSPRNKDRLAAQAAYSARYVGYLLQGIHLLLVDVHRRPLSFSFADNLNKELELQRPSCPAPFAISYRVGEPAASGGRFLAFWRRPLTIGEPLPTLPLPLSVQASVAVDLEATYRKAAEAAYLT